MKTLQKYKNIPKSLKLMSKIIHFQKTFFFLLSVRKTKRVQFLLLWPQSGTYTSSPSYVPFIFIFKVLL